jgi:hypothetical protein
MASSTNEKTTKTTILQYRMLPLLPSIQRQIVDEDNSAGGGGGGLLLVPETKANDDDADLLVDETRRTRPVQMIFVKRSIIL